MGLKQQSKDFYAAGFDSDWKSVSMLVEDMSRNGCFSRVRISHVLRFTSICDQFTDSPLYKTSRGIFRIPKDHS
jgi:hypothetical protein